MSEITDLISAVAGIEGDAKEYISVKIPVSTGSATFDSSAVEAIAKDTENVVLTLAIEDVTAGSLEQSVQTYEITLKKNGESIGENAFTAGKATVVLPIPEGIIEPVVYYVADDGSKQDMQATVSDGSVSFETNHFSAYTIEDKAAPVFVTESDAGYYADEYGIENAKSGEIAFRAFLEKYAEYNISKYGFFIYRTADGASVPTLTSEDNESLKTNGGYFIGKVTDVPTSEFNTIVYAKPYSVIDGNTYYGDTVKATVGEIGKWLGAKEAE